MKLSYVLEKMSKRKTNFSDSMVKEALDWQNLILETVRLDKDLS